MRKVTLPLQMGTPRRDSSPMAVAALCAALVTVAGCGSAGTGNLAHSPSSVAEKSPSASAAASPSAGATPSARPSASPPPAVTGSYGVLAGPFSGATYTVTLVGVDGKVVASAQASTSPSPTCAGQAAGLVPYPVSTSNSRAYFMDAQGVVRFLAPNGDTGRATTVPASTASRRSTFAVSPDDQRIAVVVIDFTSGGASTRLYVEDLNGGGNHVDTFTETGSYTLWPIGWHAGNLVVAKVASCTQGGGPTCCGPLELHVVDPVTAARKYTLGGPSCIVVGVPTPDGTMCEDTTFTKAIVVSWTGASITGYPISGPEGAFLSPIGDHVALVDNTGTSIAGSNVTWPRLIACGWIDDIHVLSGGDQQQQPLVGEFPSGVQLPVAAVGACAGRLPGGL
jgi:hypothetical protein